MTTKSPSSRRVWYVQNFRYFDGNLAQLRKRLGGEPDKLEVVDNPAKPYVLLLGYIKSVVVGLAVPRSDILNWNAPHAKR